MAGSTTLALALAAGASQACAWVAVVNRPDLGVVAAAELGVQLGRCCLVPDPGPRWPTVVAALLDGVEVILLRPPARVPVGIQRRLAARARERDTVLLVTGDWPHADLRVAAGRQRWLGLGRGHGHLRARRMEVVAAGRAGTRRRTAWLWLPDAHGEVTLAAVAKEPVRQETRWSRRCDDQHTPPRPLTLHRP